ncbi:MAG: DNA repair protein RecO, partial [Clostridia bacterium]
MQETKVKGIVLGAIDFKEKDKLLSVFTLEEGLLSVVLKGVKSANAKNKFAKEPFCFADFILQGSGDFRLATEIGIIDSFYDITKNLDNFYAGSIVLNVVKCVVKNGNSNEPLFVEVLKALKGLSYDNLNPKLVLILFLNRIISSFGYRFNLD